MAFVQVGRNGFVGYEQRGPAECWPWLASCTAQGYGQAFCRRLYKVRKAHQVVYELLTGLQAPERSSGLEFHHRCRNRRCVNPAHLQIVTVQVNRALRVFPPRLAPSHGTTARYNSLKHRCHCPLCRQAWAFYLKTWRSKHH